MNTSRALHLLVFSGPLFMRTGIAGILKSLAYAMLIVLLTGLLEKRRIRLKG